MPLTGKFVEHAHKKPGRHSDGKGLYLLVKPSGSASWVLRVQTSLLNDGKRTDYGLGPLHTLTLAEARNRAEEGRKLAKHGLNPSLARKRETVPTFEEAARRYHAIVERGWKKGKHGKQWLSTLEAHAFGTIGNVQVNAVDTAAIQRVLLPIWLTIPETARRVRQRLGAVLDYAFAQGWRETEAPMRAIAKGLPKQSKKRGHFAAMPHADLPRFIDELCSNKASIGRLALRFTILTVVRSGETRGAIWSEFDLVKGIWTIPAERMKAGEQHIVPLSKPALEILREMLRLSNGDPDSLVFPGARGRVMSNMTMPKALKTSGGEGFTVHGFRSSFRDWVADTMVSIKLPAKEGQEAKTALAGDVAESALAHALPNRVEAAYRRTKFLDHRHVLAERWADYLAGASNVVRLAANG